MGDGVYRETYDEMKKQGHCQKTSYDKYRQRLSERDIARRRQEYEDRKIRTRGSF